MGRINYRGSQRARVPGRTWVPRKVHAATARTQHGEIDEEVRRIIDEAIEKVRHIVETRRPALEALTQRLIEVESVDAEELQQIIEESSPGPQVVPGTTEPRRAASSTESSNKSGDASSERQG